MSSAPMPESNPASTAPLQFDSAEPTEGFAGGKCQRCSGPLVDCYYQVDGAVACAACADQRTREWNGGNPVLRLCKAAALGLIGAALGFGLYYGVEAISGYEIGLVAIVVGVMVGALVKAGSNGRGGWGYQLMAVLFTYCAITASYAASHDRFYRQLAEALPSIATQPVDPDEVEQREAIQRFVERPWIARMLYFLKPAVTSQFDSSNILGLLIIGFALFSAWRTAAHTPVPVTGPFQITQIASPPPPPLPASAANHS